MWFVIGYVNGAKTLLSKRVFTSLETAEDFADRCSDALDPFVVEAE